MLVSAVTSLSYVSTYFDEWIEADALIVGRNISVHFFDGQEENRRLIDTNIPDFTAGNLGNVTNLFENITIGIPGEDAIMDEQGNRTTDAQHNSTQGTTDYETSEDIDFTLIPTSAPTPMVPPGTGARLVYCAKVQFQIDGNVTITTVSDTYCSFDPNDIVLGHSFGIMYNPDQPQEIIEEALYVHASNTLRLTVGVTVFFTTGYLLCSIYLWRSQPDMVRVIFPHTGHDLDFQDDSPNGQEITQTPEEREALIQSKFCFQTVLEDLSNTDAATIRRLCLNGGEEEEKGEDNQCCSKPSCCKHETAEASDEDDIEAQQDAHEDDLELDLTKSDSSLQNSTSNTEAETDTDAGSNVQGSVSTDTSDSKQPQQQSPQDPESAWSLTGATNLIASWTNAALTPPAPECCICLETYQPGDEIATPKNSECSHVFHKACIEAWMRKHNCCPLCRVDLMNWLD